MPRPPNEILLSTQEAGRRVFRRRQGLKQVELARSLGMPQSDVSEMDSGFRGFTIHQVVKRAKALKVSTDAVLLDYGEHEHKLATRLQRRLQPRERLPESRQRVLPKGVEALIDQETTGAGQRERC